MLPNRLDFWNDERRWDGITDTHKEMFWMVRRPDVIKIAPTPEPPASPYAAYMNSIPSPSLGSQLQHAQATSFQYGNLLSQYQTPSPMSGILGILGL